MEHAVIWRKNSSIETKDTKLSYFQIFAFLKKYSASFVTNRIKLIFISAEMKDTTRKGSIWPLAYSSTNMELFCWLPLLLLIWLSRRQISGEGRALTECGSILKNSFPFNYTAALSIKV